MQEEKTTANQAEEARIRKKESLIRNRRVLGTLIILLAIVYAASVVTGLVDENHRIDSITLALLALGIICGYLLMTPSAFERFKMFEVRGFKLEMLEKVKDKQVEQEHKLDDINLMLPLLFSSSERKHLLNLADHKTAGYFGNHNLRTELRRLRSIKLIRMVANHNMSDLKDDPVNKVDLARFVELTTLGTRWVKKIREIEEDEIKEK